MQNVLLQVNGRLEFFSNFFRGRCSIYTWPLPFTASCVPLARSLSRSLALLYLAINRNESTTAANCPQFLTHFGWTNDERTTRDVYWFRLAIYFTPMIRWRKPLKPPPTCDDDDADCSTVGTRNRLRLRLRLLLLLLLYLTWVEFLR